MGASSSFRIQNPTKELAPMGATKMPEEGRGVGQ